MKAVVRMNCAAPAGSEPNPGLMMMMMMMMMSATHFEN
jgi:hypothetical protein